MQISIIESDLPSDHPLMQYAACAKRIAALKDKLNAVFYEALELPDGHPHLEALNDQYKALNKELKAAERRWRSL